MRFDDIYEEHFHNIYRYIFYMVSDTQLAEDLTQEVFLQIYKSNSKPQTIATYIRQVARHLVIDYYRKRALFSGSPLKKNTNNMLIVMCHMIGLYNLKSANNYLKRCKT